MERRLSDSRKGKFSTTGKPERYTPSSTIAKFGGGTRTFSLGSTSSFSAAGRNHPGASKIIAPAAKIDEKTLKYSERRREAAAMRQLPAGEEGEVKIGERIHGGLGEWDWDWVGEGEIGDGYGWSCASSEIFAGFLAFMDALTPVSVWLWAPLSVIFFFVFCFVFFFVVAGLVGRVRVYMRNFLVTLFAM